MRLSKVILPAIGCVGLYCTTAIGTNAYLHSMAPILHKYDNTKLDAFVLVTAIPVGVVIGIPATFYGVGRLALGYYRVVTMFPPNTSKK